MVTEGQRVGPLAEASAAHQAGLLVHLLWAGEVLPAAFVVAVAALEVLTEEAMEEAAMAVTTGELKGNVSKEGPGYCG